MAILSPALRDFRTTTELADALNVPAPALHLVSLALPHLIHATAINLSGIATRPELAEIMTTTNGDPFREHDSRAAEPSTREIHTTHPFPYRIPSGRLPGEDGRRISLQFRAVAHFERA